MKKKKLPKCSWCGEPIKPEQERPQEKTMHRIGDCFLEDKKKNPDQWKRRMQKL